MATTTEKQMAIVFAFNTFFGDLLRQIKTLDPSIKKTLKKRYRVLDRSSPVHVDHFAAQAREAGAFEAAGSPYEDTDPLERLNMEVAKDIRLAHILSAKDLSEAKKRRVLANVALLAGIAHLRDELENDEDASWRMFEALMNRLSGDEGAFRDVLDDEALETICRRNDELEDSISVDPEVRSAVNGNKSSNLSSGDVFGSMFESVLSNVKGSKLGEIAEEISSGLDRTAISNALEKDGGFDNVVKNLMKGENVGLFGDLVQSVGDKITEKIKNGNMKEEELLQDAFGILSQLKNFQH